MNINNAEDLKAAIIGLEQRERLQKQQLQENFSDFKESLSPVNLIKNTFAKAKETPGVSGSLFKAGLGLGVGILTKRLVVGKKGGFFKNLLGGAVEMGVMGLVAKNADKIQSSVVRVLSNIAGKKRRRY